MLKDFTATAAATTAAGAAAATATVPVRGLLSSVRKLR